MDMGTAVMSGMRILFWEGNDLSPRPLFRIRAKLGTRSATQPTPNYWTCNLPCERLLTQRLMHAPPTYVISDSDFGEWTFPHE